LVQVSFAWENVVALFQTACLSTTATVLRVGRVQQHASVTTPAVEIVNTAFLFSTEQRVRSTGIASVTTSEP
jgi:hypothetical protein